MPKPNRPLVRDGRLQAPKKRTDRSYLRPSTAPTEIVPVEDEPVESPADVGATAEPETAFAPPLASPARAAKPGASAAAKLPTTVRAIQQQGVRKRRDVDLKALALRDTNYAYHELRRIAVLATMVIVTLVVLWVVLR